MVSVTNRYAREADESLRRISGQVALWSDNTLFLSMGFLTPIIQLRGTTTIHSQDSAPNLRESDRKAFSLDRNAALLDINLRL